MLVAMKTCRIEGCEDTRLIARSLICNKHRYKKRMTGTYDNMEEWYSTRAAEQQANKSNQLPKGQHMDMAGYVRKYVAGKQVFYHRWLMEQELGRPLTKDESVHHINGNRTDNRIENLELWSRYQPTGQRVADKLAYAREIIALYG